MSEPIKVKGYVQSYAWGMGAGSIVQRFSGDVAANGKYAELWFGAHPNGQATIVGAGQTQSLSDLVKNYPGELLGAAVVSEYGKQLPFLFKFLSVGSALSIQAHPDRERPGVSNEYSAEKLHAGDPGRYKDKNPKPEVGIALSEVELLYGFRPVDQIVKFLEPGPQEVCELVQAVGKELAETIVSGQLSDRDALKRIYHAVLTLPEDRVTELCHELFARLEQKTAEDLSAEESWILTLRDSYPDGDTGLFSLYILNHAVVPEGKALFIGPNIPHAYLKNELAECMAPSDNVVRAGLTSKYIDVATLLGMLDYSPQAPVLLDPVSTAQAGYSEFPVPLDRWFQLGVVRCCAEAVTFTTNNRIEMVVVTGAATITGGAGQQHIRAGEAAIIPALVPEYSVQVESGQLFRARVP